MNDPLGVLTILVLYLMIVFYGWDYAHRQSRKRTSAIFNEFILNVCMFIYNWSMTILNGWIAYEVILAKDTTKRLNIICPIFLAILLWRQSKLSISMPTCLSWCRQCLRNKSKFDLKLRDQ